MSIKDVSPSDLTHQLSKELKKRDEIQPPEWSHFTKTGAHKERPPDQPDWWYLRSASILRRVYEKGPIGVSRLSTYYGGKKTRGSAPEKSRKGSRKITRTILQQLEDAGLIIKTKREGRKISSDGTSLLTQISMQIQGESGTELEES